MTTSAALCLAPLLAIGFVTLSAQAQTSTDPFDRHAETSTVAPESPLASSKPTEYPPTVGKPIEVSRTIKFVPAPNSDGPTLQRSDHTYRDSQGRIRYETAAGPRSTMITISDYVARKRFRWLAGDSTVQVTDIGPYRSDPPPAPLKPDAPVVLGYRTDYSQDKDTPSAGDLTETWYAPEIGQTLKAIQHNKNGTTTLYNVTRVKVGEPKASLFVPPGQSGARP